jgi:hypothetical protein
MKFKKALPRAPVVLSAEERRCVIQFVGILVEVDQRVGVKRANARCRKNQCVSDNKRKASEEKGTRLKQKQKNKARKFCGPCFFVQTLYHVTVDLAFIQRDYSDRHHSFNIH